MDAERSGGIAASRVRRPRARGAVRRASLANPGRDRTRRSYSKPSSRKGIVVLRSPSTGGRGPSPHGTRLAFFHSCHVTGRWRRLVTDPVASAKAAGLTYVAEGRPGLTRRRAGRAHPRRRNTRTRVRDRAALARIRALAIPPAWRDVWICGSPYGHIQAVGRDARGRKQYRYHSRWRQTRDQTKYARMLAFARSLPRIRARVRADLAQPGLPRAKVLATVVRLLETTLIRVGNEAYARTNGSFGLTTMRARHVAVRGAMLRFHFRGKGGKEHAVDVRDPSLARIVRQCQDLPGQDVFQYVDDEGTRQSIDSPDVNGYLREVAGEEFTAKDFRTWAGTVLAALALAEVASFASKREARRNITRAVTSVAARLGNTPAISRRCYVHPAVIEAYMDGLTLDAYRRRAERAITHDLAGLDRREAVVLGLLQQRLARATERAAA